MFQTLPPPSVPITSASGGGDRVEVGRSVTMEAPGGDEVSVEPEKQQQGDTPPPQPPRKASLGRPARVKENVYGETTLFKLNSIQRTDFLMESIHQIVHM